MSWRLFLRQMPNKRQRVQTIATLEAQSMSLNVDYVDKEMLVWLHSSSFNPAAARITLEALSGLRVEFEQKDILRAQLEKALDIHQAQCKENGPESTAIERCVRASMVLRDPVGTPEPMKWQQIPAIRIFSRSVYALQQPDISIWIDWERFNSAIAVAFMAYSISLDTPLRLCPVIWSELLESSEWWFKEGRNNLSNAGLPDTSSKNTAEIQKQGLYILCQLFREMRGALDRAGLSTRWDESNGDVAVNLREYFSCAGSQHAAGIIRFFLAIFCWDFRLDMPKNCAALVSDIMQRENVGAISF
jgi:hypothetical protein